MTQPREASAHISAPPLDGWYTPQGIMDTLDAEASTLLDQSDNATGIATSSEIGTCPGDATRRDPAGAANGLVGIALCSAGCTSVASTAREHPSSLPSLLSTIQQSACCSPRRTRALPLLRGAVRPPRRTGTKSSPGRWAHTFSMVRRPESLCIDSGADQDRLDAKTSIHTVIARPRRGLLERPDSRTQ